MEQARYVAEFVENPSHAAIVDVDHLAPSRPAHERVAGLGSGFQELDVPYFVAARHDAQVGACVEVGDGLLDLVVFAVGRGEHVGDFAVGPARKRSGDDAPFLHFFQLQFRFGHQGDIVGQEHQPIADEDIELLGRFGPRHPEFDLFHPLRSGRTWGRKARPWR